MSVAIRLRRMGKKKQPFYRIVAIDSRKARNGRFLETVGTYNPITKPAVVNLHESLLTKWLDDGAIPSDTVSSLMTQVGFTEKYHRAKKGEDVSAVELKTTLTERKKRTQRMKKAALAAAEAKAKEAEAAPAAEAAPEAAEGGDAPAE